MSADRWALVVSTVLTACNVVVMLLVARHHRRAVVGSLRVWSMPSPSWNLVEGSNTLHMPIFGDQNPKPQPAPLPPEADL